jgi:hypothetical protein
MVRLALLAVLLLAAGAMACGDGATQYDVTVEFNALVTQDDIDEVAALLRTFDDDLEFVILERFPPQGRATLATDAPDFCRTIEVELTAKTYVDSASCRLR